jgi:hypothetical protein
MLLVRSWQIQVLFLYALASGELGVRPVEPGARLYTYMGSLATFLAAGFSDMTPPGRERLIMRYASRPSR